MMVRLQQQGCHNINIVTPSHVIPQVMRAIGIAADQGLHIPVVYNSGGYDAVETLRLLDGIVDIYMPDAKYGSDDVALALSHAPDYGATMQAALKEMHRQTGDLVIENGIAVRGMIIRHLVLPENLAGSDRVLPWIAEELSRDSYVNIMNQYHWPTSLFPPEIVKENPKYHALLRSITAKEYADAIGWAKSAGLHRGFKS
jgi:putative pyruvate formate lyase activating enzyme